MRSKSIKPAETSGNSESFCFASSVSRHSSTNTASVPNPEVRQRTEGIEGAPGVVVSFERVAGPLSCCLYQFLSAGVRQHRRSCLNYLQIILCSPQEIYVRAVTRPALI